MGDPVSSFLKDIFLALVQGLSEIFPLSSSGHLVLFSYLLGRPISFNQVLFLHFGTFLAILTYYRKKVWSLIVNRKNWRLFIYFLASFSCTALVGLIFRGLAAKIVAEEPTVVAGLLMLNGVALGMIGLLPYKWNRQFSELTLKEFIIIGLIQGIATLPGISRLGITLGMGLFWGLSWFEALDFAFLLSLPTLLFANIYIWSGELIQTTQFPMQINYSMALPMIQSYLFQHPSIAWALLISFGCGLAALSLLLKYFGRKLLIYFAIYSFATGLFFHYLIKLL